MWKTMFYKLFDKPSVNVLIRAKESPSFVPCYTLASQKTATSDLDSRPNYKDLWKKWSPWPFAPPVSIMLTKLDRNGAIVPIFASTAGSS